MSYFGTKLKELLKQTGTSAAELSRITGITEGLISRWTRFRQDFVSHEDLAALTAAIPGNKKQKAELIKAHLQDENVGEGSDLINIEIRGEELNETITPYKSELPAQIQQELHIIGIAAINDPDVRKIVQTVSKMVSRPPSRT